MHPNMVKYHLVIFYFVFLHSSKQSKKRENAERLRHLYPDFLVGTCQS